MEGPQVGYDDFFVSRKIAGLAALVAVAAAANAAWARPPASSLSWTRLPGAEACIGAPDLARRVEARVGRDVLVAPSRADLSVEGRVGPREGGGWRAVIEVARPGGQILSQRTLETRERSCRVLDPALALVVALAIDPDGGAGVAPAAEVAPRVIIREVRVPVPVPVHEPWTLDARAAGGVEAGVLPSPAWGGELGLWVEAPGLPRIALGGVLYLGQDQPSDLPDRSVRLRLGGIDVGVCPSRRVWSFRWVACAGLGTAWLSVRGEGFEAPEHHLLWVPFAAADLAVEIPLGLGPVQAVAGAGLRVPLRQVRVTYDRSAAAGGGQGVLYDAAPVSVRLAIGLLVHIL